jgi:hypothetical protein
MLARPKLGAADRGPLRAVVDEMALTDSLDAAAIQRWEPVAESLVRKRVTSKHPRLVATILARSARPACRRAPSGAPTGCATPLWAGPSARPRRSRHSHDRRRSVQPHRHR